MGEATKINSWQWKQALAGCYMALATIGFDVAAYEIVGTEGDSYLVAPKHADEALWELAGRWDSDWA